jgi:hypothetical protein
MSMVRRSRRQPVADEVIEAGGKKLSNASQSSNGLKHYTVARSCRSDMRRSGKNRRGDRNLCNSCSNRFPADPSPSGYAHI